MFRQSKLKYVVLPVTVGFLAVGCSSEPTANIGSCLSDPEKSLCIEQQIKNISNKKVTACITQNIDAKEELSLRMTENKATEQDVKDIDNLARECFAYMEQTPEGQNNNAVPIFSTFIAAAAGAYVGQMIAGSIYQNMNNYNNRDERRGAVVRTVTGGGYVSRSVPATTTGTKYKLGATGEKWAATSSKYNSKMPATTARPSTSSKSGGAVS